jgi:hypothetical protein
MFQQHKIAGIHGFLTMIFENLFIVFNYVDRLFPPDKVAVSPAFVVIKARFVDGKIKKYPVGCAPRTLSGLRY